MSDDLITLCRYRDLPEALIAHSKLRAEGFACFLADDNIVRFNWYLSNAIGGVRLRVREDDAESALSVLGQEIPKGFSTEDVGQEYEQPACPKCGSRDVDSKPCTGELPWWRCGFLPFPCRAPRAGGIAKIAGTSGKASTSRL